MAVTCSVQELLDSNPCLGVLNVQDLEMLRYGLLCRIWERVQGGPTTDCSIEDILEETECARPYYPTSLRVIETQLVLNIAGYVGLPAISPCVAALSPWFLQLVITALLCQIIEAIESGVPAVDCDIQTLLDTAVCYNMLLPFELARIQVSQLCTINEIIPAVPPTPPACTLVISSSPSDVTQDSGTDFSLSVAWTGAHGTGTVQWQRDDGGPGWLDVVDGTFDGTTASGAQTPTLTVTNAQDFNTGSYRAIVTDPAITGCTATSNAAIVTINPVAGNFLLPGLLAFWRFDESGGNAPDASGNGHTLTQQNGSVSAGTGIVNGARQYTQFAPRPYFSNPDPVFNLVASPFTITAWGLFSPRGVAPNDMTVIAKGSYPLGTLSYWILLDHGEPDDLLSFYYSTDGSTLQVLSVAISGGVDAGVFYFMALRWDGVDLKLSLTPQDAVAVEADETVPFAGPFYSTSDALLVGDMPLSPIHGFDGFIDEMGVWERALSDCEVAKLFAAKAGTFSYPDFTAGVCA